MGLDLQHILLGDNNNYLDNFKAKPNAKFSKEEDAFNVFMVINGMDCMLKEAGGKLCSIASITYINDNSFMHYEIMKKKNYLADNIIIPYGFGTCYHTVNDEKFRLVSVEKAVVNHEPIFLSKHPISEIIMPFSERFVFDSCKSVCDFREFALIGHVHNKTGKEIMLNKDSEFFFEKPFFLDEQSGVYEFVQVFRESENKIKFNAQFINNFDYSHMLLFNEGKYYYYSEASSVNIKGFHNRFGIITELTPAVSGISGAKAGLVNYFECLNNLKILESLADSPNFNHNQFVSLASSRLGSIFK